MTPIFHPIGDKLVEQPRMKEPSTLDYIGITNYLEVFRFDLTQWQLHVDSLRTYAIRPEDWQGITEVREGEFEVGYQAYFEGTGWGDCAKALYDTSLLPSRLLAVPVKPAEKIEEVWVAYHNDCIHESAAYPISIHKTKEGAEKAMEWHKQEAYTKWKEINDYHVEKEGEPWGVIFGKHEAWFVASLPLLP